MSLERDTTAIKQIFEAEDIFQPASAEEAGQRKAEAIRKNAIRAEAAEKIESTVGIAKDVASEATFDDFTINEVEEDYSGRMFWTQVCKPCAKRFKLNPELIMPDAAGGICGVVGCENEAEHYYDFDTAETVNEAEENIFKGASREEYRERRGQAWEELLKKFAVGTKVKYYEGISGVLNDPAGKPVSPDPNVLIGTVKRVYDSTPPPLRIDHVPSAESAIVDVYFPKIDRVYNLHPSSIEVVEESVTEAEEEEVFKPASEEEYGKRQDALKQREKEEKARQRREREAYLASPAGKAELKREKEEAERRRVAHEESMTRGYYISPNIQTSTTGNRKCRFCGIRIPKGDKFLATVVSGWRSAQNVNVCKTCLKHAARMVH